MSMSTRFTRRHDKMPDDDDEKAESGLLTED